MAVWSKIGIPAIYDYPSVTFAWSDSARRPRLRAVKPLENSGSTFKSNNAVHAVAKAIPEGKCEARSLRGRSDEIAIKRPTQCGAGVGAIATTRATAT